MLFFGRKKHIKILAKKFNHTVEFSGNSLIIKSNINYIKLSENQKNKVAILYNIDDGENEMLVEEMDFIDVLFEVLRREKLELVETKEGELLSVNRYMDEVGIHYTEDKIRQIKASIINDSYKNEILKGNRMEAEVYDSLLILTDDLRFYKTNTIDISDIF